MNKDYEFILSEIRRKLHDVRGSKAAVMVGSGFSRNARPRFPNSNPLPLWHELNAKIVNALYSDRGESERIIRTASATSAGLRIAEEFEAAHGRAALIEVVRNATSDDDFEPSELHEALIDLPWADVFTTNYDRLLERSLFSRKQNTLRKRSYETVVRAVDLAIARRPRIIKLHGSLPDLNDMVLTEEDFRLYPTRQAAFVSAVKSSLSENAFCLLGFSGDDPNFLAWTGWVRDTFRGVSPQIYLFSHKSLLPFRRKLLEQRNIIPIPLEAIFNTGEYDKSIGKLLEYLGQDPAIETVGWNRPRKSVLMESDASRSEPFDNCDTAHDLIATAVCWRANRQQYLGWEILPRVSVDLLFSHTRWNLQSFTPAIFESLRLEERIFVVREVMWRLEKCLHPIPNHLVEQIVLPLLLEKVSDTLKFADLVINPGQKSTCISAQELSQDLIYIKLQLLRYFREIGDDSGFERFALELKNATSLSEDEKCFLEYQRVLHLFGNLAHDEGRDLLKKWNPEHASAIWTVRRCGLLMEAGEIRAATKLLIKVADRLTSRGSEPIYDYRKRSIEGLVLQSIAQCNRWQRINSRDSGTHDGTDEQQYWSIVDDMGLSERDLVKKQRAPRPQVLSDTQGAKPSEQIKSNDIENRLSELSSFGCNPTEWKAAFFDMFRSEKEDESGERFVFEGFDVGERVMRTRNRDSDVLRYAWAMVRYFEDAGLPFTIHGVIGMSVAGNAIKNCILRIVNSSAEEGLNLVCRLGDDELILKVLDRTRLSRLNNQLVSKLFNHAVASFSRAASMLATVPTKRSHSGEWWEHRIEVSIALLAQLTPRVSEGDLTLLVNLVLTASSNVNLWRRGRTSKLLSKLTQRVLTCTPHSILANALTENLQSAVAGDPEVGFEDTFFEWIDPLNEFEELRAETVDRNRVNRFAEAVIENIKTTQGEHRKNLVLRVASLLLGGHLDRTTQVRLQEVLFEQVDTDGFPKNTGCYDSLILRLPKTKSRNVHELFGAKYLSASIRADLQFWTCVAQTADYLKKRPPAQLQISWTRNELIQLLGRSPELFSAFNAAEHAVKNSNRFAADISRPELRSWQLAFREWLTFIGEVVLLSPNCNSKVLSCVEYQIESLKAYNFCYTRLCPFLAYKGLITKKKAESEIKLRLTGDNFEENWQACAAIVHWSHLERHYKFKRSVSSELFLTELVSLRVPRFLPLYINASAELVDSCSGSISDAAYRNLKTGVAMLFDATDYLKSTGLQIETKLCLRVYAVKLVHALLSSGFKDSILSNWLEVGKKDIFAEVRRASA